MLPINLFNIKQIPLDLKEEHISEYLRYLTKSNGFKNVKIHELETLKSFINNFKGKGLFYSDLNNYYYSYHIPQISKEFDLLRVCDDIVINIELKLQVNDWVDVSNQLIKNKYYLKALGRMIYNFVYIKECNEVYKLNKDNKLVKSNIEEVIEVLKEQINNIFNKDINKLFDVTNYLVSPFNDVDKFLHNNYFLTSHQEEIKRNIIEKIKKKEILSLSGGAGTGKTLLLYDIARTLSDKYNVCIIHVANLNDGQSKLKNKGFNIYPIKDINNKNINFEKYDLVIVDEAQRLKKIQFNKIIEKQKQLNVSLLFSYDQKQNLNKDEAKVNIVKNIERIVSENNKYLLTNNIRTNKNIMNFAERIIYNNTKLDIVIDSNEIEILYAKSNIESRFIIEGYKSEGYEFVNYTPSKNSNESWEYFREVEQAWFSGFQKDLTNNPHRSIGQEYDKVLLTLGEHFSVSNHELVTKDHKIKNYDYKRMLYQILTRARKKLCIIIYNNKELFNNFTNLIKTNTPKEVNDERKTND